MEFQKVMNKFNIYFYIFFFKMSRVISYNINPNINVQDGTHKTYFIVKGKNLTKNEIQNQDNETFNLNNFYLKPDGKFLFYYPQEFVAPSETGEDKYVIFQYCYAEINQKLPTGIEIHSSIVPRDRFCDSLVYYCNLQPPDDNRKYKVNTNKQMGFEVWFTWANGDPVIPDVFTIFLKLLY